MYGMYCIEAAIDAAALRFGMSIKATHWSRLDTAVALQADHGLPDVADLLRNLNEVRKSEAYGDVESPELDAEDVTGAIEEYVEAVTGVLESAG